MHENDENASLRSRTGSARAKATPRSLGDIIREIGFGIFQILPPKTLVRMLRERNRIFIPKRFAARQSNYAIFIRRLDRESKDKIQ